MKIEISDTSGALYEAFCKKHSRTEKDGLSLLFLFYNHLEEMNKMKQEQINDLKTVVNLCKLNLENAEKETAYYKQRYEDEKRKVNAIVSSRDVNSNLIRQFNQQC